MSSNHTDDIVLARTECRWPRHEIKTTWLNPFTGVQRITFEAVAK